METRDTIPWQLHSGPPRPEGALGAEQRRQLGEAHGFDPDDLLALSAKLEIAARDGLDLSQPELIPAKRKKGDREARKAIKALQAAERKVAEACAIVEPLRFRDPFSHIGRKNPAGQHLHEFHTAAEGISRFRHHLEVMVRAGLATFSRHPDLRQIHDVRREIVCTSIFNFWDEQGRHLTYTTDPDTSERRGALIDFVNAVVTCMTDPPTRISGEAIKRELGHYNAYRKANRPPDQV